MGVQTEIRIAGDQIAVQQGRKKLIAAPLAQVVAYLGRAGLGREEFEVLPRGVRIVQHRRDAVAMGLEIAPHTRRVRWLADDSKAPFGPGASYAEYFVSFPFIMLLLVFRGGSLTGQQQLYYRTESLDRGDDLRLPNLYNVAEGYGQRCWVCLQHCPDVGGLEWHAKISAVVDHTFSAAFNRSSEEHEGNSYWSAHKAVDPRVATMEAWQEATRADRRMALSVAWTPAETTARAELRKMLDEVVRPRKLANATDFAGIVSAAAGAARRAARRTS
jgi:hypothetical protein